MKSVTFEEANVKIAEHQEEYETLHAYADDLRYSVAFCFELNKEELKEINDLTKNKMDAIVEDQVLDLDAEQIVNRLVGRKIGLTNLLQNMTGEAEANLTLLAADQTEYIR